MLPYFFVGLFFISFLALIAHKLGLFEFHRGGDNLKLLPETFIVADIETTGLDANKHEIIEIAAIRVNRDSNQHQTFSGLANPTRKIPAKITKITGITQKDLEEEGEPIGELMEQFLSFIGQDPLVFYNAPFDWRFLAKAAQDLGTQIQNPVIDALPMARRAFPGRKSYKLSDLAKDSGLNYGRAHRALVDCQVTLTVYTTAVKKLGRIS